MVSRRQALDAGVGPATIQRRLSTGRWTRLLRGTYRIGPVETPFEWASAACLAVGKSAVLSHNSAAFMHGWIGGPRPEPVHLTVVGRQPRRRPSVVVHSTAPLAADEVDHRSGLPVTARARTLLDLATVLPSRDVERIVAQLLRDEVLSSAQLHGLLHRYRNRAGIRTLRALLKQPGGPRFTRSEAEVRFLDLMRCSELPLPSTNERVGGFELDAVWPRERVVVEVDGYEYHRSRVRFEADRRKDAWLTAEGYRVIRITWRQLTDCPTRTAVQIGRALSEAKRRG